MKVKIHIYLFFIMSGCIPANYYNEIQTLKEIDKSQKEIENYIDRQKNGFALLSRDIKLNLIKIGSSKDDIIAAYGEPVLSEKIGNNFSSEKLLYRHPINYFLSDRIYLYFDNNGKLLFWEQKLDK